MNVAVFVLAGVDTAAHCLAPTSWFLRTAVEADAGSARPAAVLRDREPGLSCAGGLTTEFDNNLLLPAIGDAHV